MRKDHQGRLVGLLFKRDFEKVQIVSMRHSWSFLPFVGPRRHPENRRRIDSAHFCAALQACGIRLTGRRTNRFGSTPFEVWGPKAELESILGFLREAADSEGLREMSIVQLIQIAISK